MQACCEDNFVMTEHASRLEDLNRKLKESDLEGFVICDPDNVYYFTGSRKLYRDGFRPPDDPVRGAGRRTCPAGSGR
jgi:Xaa-Pro aminopeptidase